MALTLESCTLRTLILLRHAKSDWDHPELDDFDRPLAPRGRQAADCIGRKLASVTPAPQIVLTSTACRALQTAMLVAPHLAPNIRVELNRNLYMTSPDTMLELIRALPDSIGCAVLIGHNPGLEQLADTLCGDGKAKTLERLRDKYPTATYAQIAFEAAHWADVDYRRGRLVDYVRPKDLDACD